jgi:hypothetical protein
MRHAICSNASIVIYIRQKRPEAGLRRFDRLRPGEAAISVFAYGLFSKDNFLARRENLHFLALEPKLFRQPYRPAVS